MQITEWYNGGVSTQDILNGLVIFGLLIITGCIVYTTYYLVKALKAINSLADSLLSTTQNIKEKIQMRALITIPALIVALVSKILRKRR